MIKINKIYMFFLASAFIFAYMEGGKLIFTIFYCMLFFLIAGAFDVILHVRDISVDVSFDKHIYETEDSVQFNMMVRNKSLLPASIVVVKNIAYFDFNPKYNGHALSLRMFESKWLELNLKFIKRGVYNFGNASLNIKDFFSIFEISKNVSENRTVKVYPRIHTLKSIVTTGNKSIEILSNKKGNIEDMSTIDDIRKYRIGDSLRRIHWKVSAKHGELYTKNFETFSGEECNLFLDMNGSGYFVDDAEAVEEKLIELFCSMAEYMRCKGISSSIYISSDETKKFEIKSQEDMDELKEFFVYNYSTGDRNFAKFIEANSGKIDGTWLGIFVPRVTMVLKKAVQALRYDGYTITIFSASDDGENMQYMQQLKNTGIECYSFNEIV